MPHRAFGIYVHITWHTRFRQSLIRSADVDAVRAAIHEAAFSLARARARGRDPLRPRPCHRELPTGGGRGDVHSTREVRIFPADQFGQRQRLPVGTWVFRGVPLADSCTGRVCLRRPAAREASGPRAAMSAADPGPAARGLPGRRPALAKGRAYRAGWCGSGGTDRVGCRSRGSRLRRHETMAAPRGRGPD